METISFDAVQQTLGDAPRCKSILCFENVFPGKADEEPCCFCAHFSLSFEQLKSFRASLKHTDKPVWMKDTFFRVVNCVDESKPSVFLRLRELKSGKLSWLITVTMRWKTDPRCVSMIEVSDMDAILRVFNLAKEDDLFAFASKNLKKLASFKFFRYLSKSDEFGEVKMDQTWVGIILTVKAETVEQLKNVVNYADKMRLKPSKPKLMTKCDFDRNPWPIAEHLYGSTYDDLEDSYGNIDEKDQEDEEDSTTSSVSLMN